MEFLKMLPEELRELMADVAGVKLQDINLGSLLEKLVTHLAHAHGLDPATVTETPASAEEEAPATTEAASTDEKEGE